MPVTIPVPDARWRAGVRDRLHRGRPWPELHRALGHFRLWFRVVKGPWFVGLAVVRVLLDLSTAGWLSAALGLALDVLMWGAAAWLWVRFTGYLTWYLRIVKRARALRRPTSRRARVTDQAVTS